MEVNEGDKLELENFSPRVANKSKSEVCLYFFPIDKHVLYFLPLGFPPDSDLFGVVERILQPSQMVEFFPTTPPSH